MAHSNDVELKVGDSKAIIEGKTAVPFKTLVMLVLQRKVLTMFKKWGDDPVIVSSELLTGLASAPQDNPENRSHLVVVSLGVGLIGGIFVSTLILLSLSYLHVVVGRQELAIVAGSIFGVTLLAWLVSKMERKNRAQTVTETMEKVAGFLSK